MFFTYSQNNSGGSFEFDEKAGISHYVIISADSAEDADKRAERIGLYFDGCESGRDCNCCGDRWSNAYDKGDKVPSIYGKSIKQTTVFMLWMNGRPEVFIHYKNGKVVPFTPAVEQR